MIKIIAKLFVAIVFTTLLHIAPLAAQLSLPFVFLANNGSGANCTSAAPCNQLSAGLGGVQSGGEIICLNSTALFDEAIVTPLSVTIDCPGLFLMSPSSNPALQLDGTNQAMKIRNLTFNGLRTSSAAIKVTGSGTLILENCVFEKFGAGIALDIEPNGPLNLVITNSRVSNNTAAGVLIKPASGGSVTATFDGVTITNNGGGIKTDTTNGSVTVDIFNSNISKNTNNGLVIIGGAGTPNIVTLTHDVIASNGQAGIEAIGTTAAAFVDTTLLDSNFGGAISVSSGRVITYGNNRIISNPGSGFTGSVPLN